MTPFDRINFKFQKTFEVSIFVFCILQVLGHKHDGSDGGHQSCLEGGVEVRDQVSPESSLAATPSPPLMWAA